jgi:TonB family protein
LGNELRKAVWTGTLALTLTGLAAWPAGAQDAEAVVARKVIKRVIPTYPSFALQSHLVGTVRLLLIVSPDGTVKSLKTLGGNPVLASAAEIAMKQWKFEPAKKETNESVAFKFDGQ